MQGNKKILLTGASGFLGKVLRENLGSVHDIITVGRAAENNIVCDLSTTVPSITQRLDWIIHNAGKAHVVPKTEEAKVEFYRVNVTGTNNLLKGIETSGHFPETFVFISTIAVYGLTEGVNIPETFPLNAGDPYGKSKIEAEALIGQWCSRHNVKLVILRLPLIAGANPPGNLGAMIRGIRKGLYAGIGDGMARKSIVMANDIARAIPDLTDHPGIYHLTDGYHPSFRELEQLIAAQENRKPPRAIPLRLAKLMGVAGDIIDMIMPGKSPVTSSKIKKITSTLTFDDQKARKVLNWQPQKVLDVFRTR